MSDLNKEALDVWGGLKPMIDQEISSRTQGMVQRRKAKVTTAPSLATNTIGVTEAFGQEIFLPFVSNMISAKVGDFVWIEWMYGATNAFVSSFAAVDDKDLTVAGTLDVVPRRCEATLPTSGNGAGWYRAIEYDAYDSYSALGYSGEIVTIKIVYTSSISCQHLIKLFMSYNKIVFLGEESSGAMNIVGKIRYCVNGSKGYVDIQYNTTSSLQVNVSFDVASRIYAQSRWKAYGLVKTADSPVSPETVLTTYSFAANTNDDTTLTAYGKTFYFHKRNGVVYIEAPDAMTPTSNGNNWVGTLPTGFRPSGVVRFDAAGSAGAYKVLYIDSSGDVSAICYTTANVSTSFGITGSYISAS